MAGKREFCSGCRDDFYNHRSSPGFDGATECWSLKSAKVVTKYRLHWWASPTCKKNFTKVKTNSCHHEPGQFAFMDKIPEFAR